MNYPTVIIECPNGRWKLAGSVPTKLAWLQEDGSEPTEKQLDTARHCGPGFARLKTRTWATKAEAEAALASL